MSEDKTFDEDFDTRDAYCSRNIDAEFRDLVKSVDLGGIHRWCQRNPMEMRRAYDCLTDHHQNAVIRDVLAYRIGLFRHQQLCYLASGAFLVAVATLIVSAVTCSRTPTSPQTSPYTLPPEAARHSEVGSSDTANPANENP